MISIEVAEVGDSVRSIIRDLNKVQRRVVPRVTRAALNHAADRVRTAAVKDIAKAKGFEAPAPVRRRFRVARASAVRRSALVWVGLLPVSAAAYGRVRKTSSGVVAGAKTFPGAFLIRRGLTGQDGASLLTKGGRARTKVIGIFKRKGRARLPIERETLPILPEAEAVTARHLSTTGREAFNREFERLLAVVL